MTDAKKPKTEEREPTERMNLHTVWNGMVASIADQATTLPDVQGMLAKLRDEGKAVTLFAGDKDSKHNLDKTVGKIVFPDGRTVSDVCSTVSRFLSFYGNVGNGFKLGDVGRDGDTVRRSAIELLTAIDSAVTPKRSASASAKAVNEAYAGLILSHKMGMLQSALPMVAETYGQVAVDAAIDRMVTNDIVTGADIDAICRASSHRPG